MAPNRYPSPAELEVLVALKEHHYLTVEQVMLATGRSSLRATQQRLKDLADGGLAANTTGARPTFLRPLRAAWSLTGRSKAYVEGAEMVVLPPRQPRPYTLDHVLAINDVLVRARVLATQCPALVELLDLHHDRDLRTWTPPLSVVPDGFVHFAVATAAGRHSFPVLVEVDLGTMDRRRWQDKVARYLRFFDGEFQRVFATDAATVAVVVGDDHPRVADLKRWTEQELTRRDATDSGELFYFTLLADGLSPAELFWAPRFLVAFTAHREPLLPVSPAGTTG